MRRSLTLLASLFFTTILIAENYINLPVETSAKGDKKYSRHMPSEIDRRINPQSRSRDTRSYLLITDDTYCDGMGGLFSLHLNGTPVEAEVLDIDGDPTGATVTLDSWDPGSGCNSLSFDVDDFDHLAMEYSGWDSWPWEQNFMIYNEFGVLVAQSTNDNDGVYPFDPLYIDFSTENAFLNSGLEYPNPNDPGRPADWGFYPNYNISYETTGNGMWQNENLFEAFDGEKSMKIWNSGGENNVFQQYDGYNAGAPGELPQFVMAMEPGTIHEVSAHVAMFDGDLLVEGMSAKLTAKYFGPHVDENGFDTGQWWNSFIRMDVSTVVLDASSLANFWTELTLTTIAPENAYHVEIGLTLFGFDGGGGAVYFDNLVALKRPPVYGCTDAIACNFDDLADIDDGSCCFENCNDIEVTPGSYPGEITWDITDESDVVVASGTPMDLELLCLPDGAYTFNAYDSWGDGWNGAQVRILDYEGHFALVTDFADAGAFETASAEFSIPTSLAPPEEPAIVFAAVLDLDIPSAGSTGKAIVIQAFEDVPDLSWYGYESANNNNVFTGVEWTFPAMSLDSGEVAWFARDPLELAGFMGFGWDFGAGIFQAGNAINSNGDDAAGLYLNNELFDVFGIETGEDGTGTVWEHTDSWAVRNCMDDVTMPRTPSTTFVASQWTFGGVNCSDDALTNESSNCPFPADYACGIIVGCMDEDSYTYDEFANLSDEELCDYDGDGPFYPLDAVSGASGSNLADGDTEFWLYTMEDDGYLTVSSQNATGDATNDVTLSIHDPLTLQVLTDLDGFPAENDDCCGYFGPSTVSLPVAGGASVLLQWQQPYDTEGPFTFTVTEGAVPNHPRLLDGMVGFNTAMLSWQPFVDPFLEDATNLRTSGLIEEERQRRGEYKRNKMTTLGVEYTPRRSFVNINLENISNRDATLGMTISVPVVTNGYPSEVSWVLYGPTAEVVASGVPGPDVQLAPGALTNGSYVFIGFDSWGDGWNGHSATISGVTGDMVTSMVPELDADGNPVLDADGNPVMVPELDADGNPVMVPETVTYLDGFTLLSGSQNLAEFVTDPALADLSPELSLSNFTFDQEIGEGVVTVDITNSGQRHAINVSTGHFLFNAASADCGTGASFPDGELLVPAGQTITHTVGGIMWWLETYIGEVYGSYDYGVMVDYLCTITEADETDNLLITPIDILSDIRYHAYMSSDDGETYEQVGTDLVQNTLTLTDLTAGDYLFKVSQYNITDADMTESDHSPALGLYVYGPEDYPSPMDLVGMVEGPEVELMWTAPDLTDWEGLRMASVFTPAIYPKVPAIESDESNSSPTRQGGDTFEDATVIDGLPYVMDGTTSGFAADYGPWGVMVDADADGEPDVCYGGTYFSATSTGAGADVVYSLTLENETDLEAEVCNAAYDPSLAIFTMEEGDDGSMEMVVVAASDDVCGDDGYKPFLNCVLPAGDYYVVVSGWGTSSGDYTLSLRDMDDVPPISNYTVHRTDPLGGMEMYTVPGDMIGFDQVVFVPEVGPDGGDFTYEVTAMYWEDMIASLPSNEVTLTTTAPSFECESPRNLVAESAMGNNVNLMWDLPAGGPGYVTHFDGTIAYVWGTAGPVEYNAISVFVGADLLPYHGMHLTHVDFIPFNRFDLYPEATATYQAKVWNLETGEVYSESDIVNLTDYLPLAEAPDPLEIASLELNSPVVINWAEPLAFGIHAVGSGYPMLMDAGSEGGSYRSAGDGTGLVEHAWDWTIWGYIDYPSGDGERIAIGSEGSMNFETAEYEGQSRAVENDQASFSELPNRPARDLLSYNVYRGDMHIGMAGLEGNMFMDDWVPWGNHNYHVTAMYNNSEECGESGPSNVVEVMLENTPPNGVNLNSPDDGEIYEVTFDVDADGLPVANNLGTPIAITWTQAPDADNQPVTYVFGAQVVVTEDESVLDDFSLGDENMIMNSDFEDVDDAGAMVDWINFQADGAHALVSDEDGHHVQIWGMGDLTFGSVYQSHTLADLDLSDGDLVSVDGHLKRTDDMGNNSAYVFLSFWSEEYTTMLGFETSAHMDMTMPAGDWYQFMAHATVPEGAVHMNAGVEYLNPDMVSVDADGLPVASVHADNIHVMNPIPPQTALMPTLGDIAEEAMMDLVTNLTVHWDVHSYDGWDATTSANGPFHFTVDMSDYVSEYLSTVEENNLPDVFALHNNYPNPFNPVTNITYDVPEVADVKLEIFNVMGQKVRTLASGSHEPGRYRILWNATNDFGEGLSSGMYIYKIQAGDFISVKKLVLMK